MTRVKAHWAEFGSNLITTQNGNLVGFDPAPRDPMKKRIICLLTFTVWVGSSLAMAESPSARPQNFYGFRSGQLFAERRTEFLPVVSATKRGLYVETKSGPKRVSYRAGVGLKRKFFVAANLIEITHQEANFQFQGDGAYEQAAMSQMQGLDFNYDVQISELRHTPGIDAAEQIQELEAQRIEFRDQTSESLEQGDPRWARLQDTLTLTIQLKAEHDVKNAVCLLIIPYTMADSRGKTEQKTQTALRAQYLGNIPGGVPHETTVQFELRAGVYDPANYQLQFYDGEGDPLPTNESFMLKKLTPEEVLDILGP